MFTAVILVSFFSSVITILTIVTCGNFRQHRHSAVCSARLVVGRHPKKANQSNAPARYLLILWAQGIGFRNQGWGFRVRGLGLRV